MTGLIGCGTPSPMVADGADASADAGPLTTSDAVAREGSLTVQVVGEGHRVEPGGSVTVPVMLTRTGVVGDVEVTVVGAPAGVTASRLVIPAGAAGGMLTLSAASTATPAVAMITVRGAANNATGDAAVRLTVAGRPGTPDVSLRGVGVAIDTTSPAVFVGDAALLPDGKVLVLAMRGDSSALELRRYDADGALDRAFGVDGVVSVSSGPMLKLSFASLARRDDGSILVAYGVGGGGAVTAFDAGGARLRGFGEANETQTLSREELGGAANNTFVVRSGAAVYAVAWAGADTRVCRLTVGGAVDPTFGNGGFVTVTGLGTVDIATDAAGRLVLAGYINNDATLVRLTPTGALDTSFAGDGSTAVPSGGPDFYFSVQPLTDGRIAAMVELGSNTLRVHAASSGAPDPSFSMDGAQSFPVGSYPLVTEVNRDVVVVGTASGGYDLYRMSPVDGALRTDFDGDGIARVHVATGRVLSSRAARLDAMGRMTVVGISAPDNFSPGHVVMARVWM